MKVAILVYPRPTWDSFKKELLALSKDDYRELVKKAGKQIMWQGNEPYLVSFIPQAYLSWLGDKEDTSARRAEWAMAQIVE